MRIAMIVPSLKEKGPVIVAENIAYYSNEMEFIFISLRKNSHVDKKRFNLKGIKYFELDMGKIPKFRDYSKLRRLLVELNIDIVHSHSFWPTVFNYFLRRSYKTITTLHNNPFEDFVFEYNSFLGSIMAKIMIHSCKSLDKSVAISEYVQAIHKKVGVVNTCVIYNGIEEKSQNSYKEITEEDITIVSISVLNKVKNLRESLDVFKTMKDHGLKVKYLIIGDGPEKVSLQGYCKEKEIVDVEFKGAIPREKVFEYLSKSSFLLSTSKSEGFGLVVVEAMMMGVIPICYEIPVMKEIIDDQRNGIIFTNSEEAVHKMKDIMNYKINEVSENAKNKYKKYFKVEDMSNNYVEVYKNLMNRR